MTEAERELDLMVAELESEVRRMRVNNETLERNLAAVQAERDGLKEAMERILAVSRVALWDGRPRRTQEVGPSKQNRPECND